MELLLDWFFPNGIRTNEAILLIIGFVGQGLFSARFLIQWVVSEKKRESVIPLPFWYFSLLGGITLFIYEGYRKDFRVVGLRKELNGSKVNGFHIF